MSYPKKGRKHIKEYIKLQSRLKFPYILDRPRETHTANAHKHIYTPKERDTARRGRCADDRRQEKRRGRQIGKPEKDAGAVFQKTGGARAETDDTAENRRREKRHGADDRKTGKMAKRQIYERKNEMRKIGNEKKASGLLKVSEANARNRRERCARVVGAHSEAM